MLEYLFANQALTLIILFGASLLAVVIMIGRKLVLLRSGEITARPEASLQIPHLEKARRFTLENLKKYEHIALVKIVRLYVRTANFLKNGYGEIKRKIESWTKISHINAEKQEISRFLQIVADYKRRIREIKRKIKKEEESL